MNPEEIFLLNNKDPTHQYFHDGQIKFSNIDLSFSSSNIAPITDWSVLDDLWGSNHFPIKISIDTQPKFTYRSNYKYNLKKINWEEFNSKLEKYKYILNSIDYPNTDIINQYEIFMETLNNCVLDLLSEKNRKTYTSNFVVRNLRKKYNQPWWNGECERKVRIRKANLKSIRYRCTLDQCINHNKIVAQTTRLLKKTKKKTFRSFTASINKNTPFNLIWSKIKLFKSGFSKPISHPGNKNFQNNAQKCLNKLCRPKSEVFYGPAFSLSENPDVVENDLFAISFTYNKLLFALNSFKDNSGLSSRF